jgi:NAD(P)H-hydrate epimerase
MKRVLVVGGSEEFVGAPYLAGIAALRAGAESVVVMAPEKVAWTINKLSADLMTRKLKGKYLSEEHKGAIRRQIKTADILILGNGAGVRLTTFKLMRSLMHSPILKVIDADALKALRGVLVRNAVLTPNEGEWKQLEKHSNIHALLKNGNIIVKKGSPTKILSGTRTLTIRNTNKGLQKAGTGDVLAGLIAGFLAQGLAPFAAAKKACDVGNRIATVLKKKKRGYYFLASDIAEEIRKRRYQQE